MTPRTVRIFISSPGDVEEEREYAKRVIESLRKRYPRATLQPVLWEDLPLPATASFQDTIDVVLVKYPVDVAVFILWSRLGTPLHDGIRKQDGSPYRSGTEREFDLMLAAFQQSGSKRPLILAYRRKDDEGLYRNLKFVPKSEWRKIVEQSDLAQSFVVERFRDEKGRNIRALLSYKRPIEFSDRLRIHLRNALDDLLDHEDLATWPGEPYRGLQVFDAEHSGIFFGRDDETCRLLRRLRAQAKKGCAFAVVVGASGSGKSSLARAGVAASFLEGFAGKDPSRWKCTILVPTLMDEDPIASLANEFAKTFPGEKGTAIPVDRVAEGLRRDPKLTVDLHIAPLLAGGTDDSGAASWLIVLDQMEELWTDRRFAPEAREALLAALEALARSGSVFVLATLRSDFYAQALEVAALLRMKGDRGHFDLVAPGPTALQKAIREPARVAGLRFETDDATGRTLDQAIFEDALRDPSSLPHLQYVLRELYERRDETRRLLTFAAYRSLGGVDGALQRRAEQALPEDLQATFYEILPSLVSVGAGEGEPAARRRASVELLTSSPARRRLFETLVRERFVTTGEGDSRTAVFSHDAMLRWKRIADWVEQNRGWLRVRRRVEAAKALWEESDRHPSLLLQPGLALEEGKGLLASPIELEDSGLEAYIEESVRTDRARSRRRFAIRVAAVSALSILGLFATAGGTLAWTQRAEANRQKEAKEQTAYFERIARIATELDAARTSSAVDLLKDLPPERQHLEAWLLQTLAEGSPLRLDHSGLTAMDIHGDDLITGGSDGSLRRWDLKTGRTVAEAAAEAARVNDIAIADERSLLTVDDSGRLSLRDRETLSEIVGVADDVPLTSVMLTGDGRVVTGSAAGDVRIRELPDMFEVASLDGDDWRIDEALGGESLAGPVESLLHLGGTIVIARGGSLVAWNYYEDRIDYATKSDRVVKRLASDLCGPANADAMFGFSAPKNGGAGGELVIFSSSTGRKVAFANGVNDIGDVSVSCGSQVVAGTRDGAVRIFRVGLYHERTNSAYPAPIENVSVLHGHARPVVRVAGHSSDAKLASADDQGTIKIWRMIPASDEYVRYEVDAYAVSPDESRIAIAFDAGALLLDANSRTELAYAEVLDGVQDVTFDSTGTFLVVAGAGTETLDVFGIQKLLDRQAAVDDEEQEPVLPDYSIRPFAESAGEGVASEPVRVRRIERVGERLIALDSLGRAAHVELAAKSQASVFADDVRLLATDDIDDRTVTMIDDGNLVEWGETFERTATSPVPTEEGSDAVYLCMACRPTSREVAVGRSDGAVVIVDLSDGATRELFPRHAGAITSLAYTPDGKRLLSSSVDGVLRVAEAATGTPALSLRGDYGDVRAFDGRRGIVYVDSKSRFLKTIDCRQRDAAQWWADNFEKETKPVLDIYRPGDHFLPVPPPPIGEPTPVPEPQFVEPA